MLYEIYFTTFFSLILLCSSASKLNAIKFNINLDNWATLKTAMAVFLGNFPSSNFQV